MALTAHRVFETMGTVATVDVCDVVSPDMIDPSGYVKGWATERAAGSLSAAGLHNWCVNVGGDLVASGRPEPSRVWRAAIRDPHAAHAVALVIEVDDRAVATSAT